MVISQTLGGYSYECRPIITFSRILMCMKLYFMGIKISLLKFFSFCILFFRNNHDVWSVDVGTQLSVSVTLNNIMFLMVK